MIDVNRLDFVARYCRPRTVRDGMPRPNAFWIRPGEEYLSVNVLPGGLGVEAGLVQIRKILAKKEFKTSPNGRFAVFNAERVIQYVRESKGVDVRIEHMHSPDDPTHAGIAPAGRYGENVWHKSTRTMARALSRFLRENPGSVYLVR